MSVVPKQAPKEAPRKGSKTFARALTGDVIHFPKLGPPKKAGKDAPRATSGGRPILAEGQAWPVCDNCGERLCLYLQFDVEPAFKLAFAPGSHLLIFHCKSCGRSLDFPENGRVPPEWVSARFKSFYRIMMNPPGVKEAVQRADPIMVEQHVSFAKDKEKAKTIPGGQAGVNEVKIGGLPRWTEHPQYPTCACGKPMGFVMQVPWDKAVGWKRRDRPGANFAGASTSFVFFCSVQSSPHAGLIISIR
jgi:hypothetical protein